MSYEESASYSNVSQENVTSTDLSEMDSIFGWCNGLIIILGLVTNSLILIVLSRHKIGSKTTRIILIFLAATDLLVMIVEIFIHYIPYYWRWFPVFFNDISCGIGFHIQATVITASAWYITLMTIERFVVVCIPLKAKVIFEPRIILLLCCCIPVACLIVHCYLLIDVGSKDDHGYIVCVPKDATNPEKFKAMIQVWVITYFFIPAILIVVLNTVIVIKLRRAQRTHRQLAATNSADGSTTASVKGVRKATILVVLASITFVVLMIPRGIASTLIMDSRWEYDSIPLSILDSVSYQLQYLNHATNFFVYMIANKAFRVALAKIFCRKDKTLNQLMKKGNMSYLMATTSRAMQGKKLLMVHHKIPTGAGGSNV